MAFADAIGRIEQITGAIAALDVAASGGLAGPGAASPSSAAGVADAVGMAGVAGLGDTSFADLLASRLSGLGTAGLGAVASATDAPSSPGATGAAIVAHAKSYLGVPYVLGGNGRSGIDCSGLVQQVLHEVGIEAPRRVSQQQYLGTAVPSLAQAQPGDLIVTKNADHIVIYAGDGMIVHAPYEGRTVSYQRNYLTDADIQTIRRVAPTEGADAAGTPSAAGASRADLSDLVLVAQLRAALGSAA